MLKCKYNVCADFNANLIQLGQLRCNNINDMIAFMQRQLKQLSCIATFSCIKN